MDTPIVFDLYKRVPIFHLTGEFTKEEDGGFHHSRMTTRCGEVVHEMIWIQHFEPGGEYHQATLSETSRGTYLRRDHAELIGRMCRSCQRYEESSRA